MSPDVDSGHCENRWTSPNVAWCRWTLAPSLAPRDLVSNANVWVVSALCQPMDDPGWQLHPAWLDPALTPGDGLSPDAAGEVADGQQDPRLGAPAIRALGRSLTRRETLASSRCERTAGTRRPRSVLRLADGSVYYGSCRFVASRPRPGCVEGRPVLVPVTGRRRS
jgi:hypothetical protein